MIRPSLVIPPLFFLEVIIESAAGLFTGTLNLLPINMNLETRYDFPGPLNILNFLIGSFPSFWDIGTTLFWGATEELTFILYVVLSIASALLAEWYVITNLRDRLLDISNTAGEKSKVSSRMDTYIQDKQTEW